MNAQKNRNSNGELLTIIQAQEYFNLGAATLKRLAAECNAAVKIGKSYRINAPILSKHIMRTYSL